MVFITHTPQIPVLVFSVDGMFCLLSCCHISVFNRFSHLINEKRLMQAELSWTSGHRAQHQPRTKEPAGTTSLLPSTQPRLTAQSLDSVLIDPTAPSAGDAAEQTASRGMHAVIQHCLHLRVALAKSCNIHGKCPSF